MNACIITKYLGPTDFCGSRVQARTRNRTITVAWDHDLDTDANHAFAADHLARKLGWEERGYTSHAASGPDEGTCVHVMAFITR